jgi:hypothetical protein
MPMNENDTGMQSLTAPLPDPHGQAALLLVESLIHGLCEKLTLAVPEALAIVERAIDVQREHVDAASEIAAGPMLRTQTLLETIAVSLKADEVGQWQPPRLVR